REDGGGLLGAGEPGHGSPRRVAGGGSRGVGGGARGPANRPRVPGERHGLTLRAPAHAPNEGSPYGSWAGKTLGSRTHPAPPDGGRPGRRRPLAGNGRPAGERRPGGGKSTGRRPLAGNRRPAPEGALPRRRAARHRAPPGPGHPPPPPPPPPPRPAPAPPAPGPRPGTGPPPARGPPRRASRGTAQLTLGAHAARPGPAPPASPPARKAPTPPSGLPVDGYCVRRPAARRTMSTRERMPSL